MKVSIGIGTMKRAAKDCLSASAAFEHFEEYAGGNLAALGAITPGWSAVRKLSRNGLRGDLDWDASPKPTSGQRRRSPRENVKT
jgi:hypothetical protein